MALAGKDGKVMISSSDVASISSWKLDVEVDTMETTYLGDEWKAYISGLGGWSGTFEGDFVINTDTNGQTAIQTAFLAKTSISLKLYINSTNYYSGSAFITKLGLEDAVDDIVKATFEFQGTGALSYS